MAESRKHAADEELLGLLREASKAERDVCLMRLGGPRKFRASVLSILTNREDPEDTIIQLLRSDSIPTIKILLTSIDDAPFLSRMDEEGASSWKIWRVRSQMRQFAIALMEVAQSRSVPGSLMVGLHKEDLIWNLGIVRSERVLLRPYGSGTGHDGSIRSIEFLHSREPDLVRSFTKYFDSVSYKPSTRWLSAKDLPSEIPCWPSLYKGNAILSSNLDYDGTEEPQLEDDEVCKICTNPESTEAETRWLSLGDACRNELGHFRPGRIRGPLENLRGKGLRIQKIQGSTIFDVLAEVNKLYEDSAENRETISRVARGLLDTSCKALDEFRTIADRIFPTRKTYPYVAKLRTALSEVRPFFPQIDSVTWEASMVDALELGRELEAESQVPFRDAHLKNRFWQTDKSLEELPDELIAMSEDELAGKMKSCVWDIDFETAMDAVTEWDDLFHILCFEYSDIAFTASEGDGHLSAIRNRATESLLFWRTGLMRALREHCRRLWYQKVMPKTFEKRYSRETPGYFLELARLCSKNASGFLGIRNLLDHLPRSMGETKPSDNESELLTVLSDSSGEASCLPTKSDEMESKRCLRVFVSYSHKDEQHFNHINTRLLPLKYDGIIELRVDRDIGPGRAWNSQLMSDIESADIVVFLVSPDLLASKYIRDKEFPVAYRRYREGNSIIVPVVVRPVVYNDSIFSDFQALPEKAVPVANWQNVDMAWLNIEENLRTMLKTVQEHGVRLWLESGIGWHSA